MSIIRPAQTKTHATHYPCGPSLYSLAPFHSSLTHLANSCTTRMVDRVVSVVYHVDVQVAVMVVVLAFVICIINTISLVRIFIVGRDVNRLFNESVIRKAYAEVCR